MYITITYGCMFDQWLAVCMMSCYKSDILLYV